MGKLWSKTLDRRFMTKRRKIALFNANNKTEQIIIDAIGHHNMRQNMKLNMEWFRPYKIHVGYIPADRKTRGCIVTHHNSIEECKNMYSTTKKSLNNSGYRIRFAYAVGPDNNRISIHDIDYYDITLKTKERKGMFINYMAWLLETHEKYPTIPKRGKAVIAFINDDTHFFFQRLELLPW